MPTILVKDGFKFFFYANEHEPRHIHVTKGDDYAKIELSTLRVVQDFMKPKDLKKAMAITREHNHDFEARWNEWFSQR